MRENDWGAIRVLNKGDIPRREFVCHMKAVIMNLNDDAIRTNKPYNAPNLYCKEECEAFVEGSLDSIAALVEWKALNN